ncbi:MAG: CBS domain-containing protein, partial [Candidatus Omnitrophica bacterium]|nr:CBS domain-containing protein [Candidatus Omnitrophota bacterium]
LTLGTDRYNEEIKKITASEVSSIMEKDITTINPYIEIEDVATLMIEKEIYYLLVVDKDKLVGVITKKDIVRAIAKGKG